MVEKGSVALVPLLVVLLIVGAAAAFLLNGNTNFTPQTSGKPQTSLSDLVKTKYQNPFNKNSQYVNPFADYKNPFDTLKDK